MIMNPKIKSLIDQAITEIGPEDNPSKEQTLVRFAELIIKECVTVAAKSGKVTNKSEGAKMEANRITDKILTHFGLEL